MYIQVIRRLVKANNSCPYLRQNGTCGQREKFIVCVGDCNKNCPNKEFVNSLLNNYEALDLLF